jgi:hypothetical protein
VFADEVSFRAAARLTPTADMRRKAVVQETQRVRLEWVRSGRTTKARQLSASRPMSAEDAKFVSARKRTLRYCEESRRRANSGSSMRNGYFRLPPFCGSSRLPIVSGAFVSFSLSVAARPIDLTQQDSVCGLAVLLTCLFDFAFCTWWQLFNCEDARMAKEASNTSSSANKAQAAGPAEGDGLSLLASQARDSGVSGDAVGVDKIRDLLFGNQMQDYDRRFSKLEERFLQRFKDVESEAKRNLEMYESNSKKQVESLAVQLRNEKEARAEADKEIDRNLREQNQALEKQVRALSDQLSELDRDVADRINRSDHMLREEIKQKIENVQLLIEKMFSDLSNVKTDRNLLAGLFVEVAKALNQEPVGSKNNLERGWKTS